MRHSEHPVARTPRVPGAHLATAMTLIAVDRDALSRGEDVLTPGDDLRFLAVRGGDVLCDPSSPDVAAPLLRATPPPGADRDRAVLLGRRGRQRVVGLSLPSGASDPGGSWRSLREIAGGMDPEVLGLAVTAVAMSAWHASMRFCPLCGAALAVTLAGWVLRCPDCGTEQFPRTDAAVIMAVCDAEDRLLLARNAERRSPMHSVLAGFVEPGETLESAVARETYEETSVIVDEVQYVGSQPWPFPRSLMLGFRARTDASAPPLEAIDGELTDLRWFTRDELRSEVAAGTLQLPSGVSIGHALVQDWLQRE